MSADDIQDASRHRRKPIDHVLDALEACCYMSEEAANGRPLGVFKIEFDRKKAKAIIDEYVAQNSLGRMG